MGEPLVSQMLDPRAQLLEVRRIAEILYGTPSLLSHELLNEIAPHIAIMDITQESLDIPDGLNDIIQPPIESLLVDLHQVTKPLGGDSHFVMLLHRLRILQTRLKPEQSIARLADVADTPLQDESIPSICVALSQRRFELRGLREHVPGYPCGVKLNQRFGDQGANSRSFLSQTKQ
jgi:hypothetical protein